MKTFLRPILFTCLPGVFFTQSKLHSAIYEPAILWPKKNLKVCILTHKNQFKHFKQRRYSKLVTAPYDQVEGAKQIIKKYILMNYGWDKTGISFTKGWNWCDQNDSSEIKLFLGHNKRYLNSWKKRSFSKFKSKKLAKVVNPEQYPGRSLLGKSGLYSQETNTYSANHNKKDTYLFLDINPYLPVDNVSGFIDIQKVNLIKTIIMLRAAIHEFGHVAGLSHEHARPEAKNDEFCFMAQRKRQGTMSLSLDKNSGYEDNTNSSKTYGSYDPNSSMNYCRDENIEQIKNVHLSWLDKKALRYIYRNTPWN